MSVKNSIITFATWRNWPRWTKKCVAIGLVLLCLLVVVQILYPAGHTLPFARLGAVNVAMLSKADASTRINATYNNWSRTITTANHHYTLTPEQAGLRLDVQATLNGPLAYPWWQRLIPGSLVWRMLRPVVQPEVQVGQDRLREFAATLQQQNYRAAVNATVVVEGETPRVEPGKEGVDYRVDTTMTALKQHFFAQPGELRLISRAVNPVVSTKAATTTLKTVQKLLTAPPAYILGDIKGEVPKTTFGTWLAFKPDESERQLVITLNPIKVGEFLSSLQPYVYTVNGQGVPGDDTASININQAVVAFNEVLSRAGKQQQVTIPRVALTAEQKANRTYGKSQPGLQALLRDIAAQKGNYAIALQELGGRNWAASVNGNKAFTPASTYKLFVAYAVLKNIETGTWQWNKTILGSQTVADCFDAMIILSDNPCAETMGRMVGWRHIDNQLRTLGLTGTTLNTGNPVSTASDELLFLTKLGRAEILSQASREKLLDVMKRQVYRQGIPAGAKVPVADKVGFLDGLLHDAALVYAPQGVYVLVILTDGSTWGDIANTAQRIQEFLQ